MTENDNKRKEEKKKCEKKVSYRFYAEVEYIRRTIANENKMQIYRCPICDNFHLKKKKKKKITIRGKTKKPRNFFILKL